MSSNSTNTSHNVISAHDRRCASVLHCDNLDVCRDLGRHVAAAPFRFRGSESTVTANTLQNSWRISRRRIEQCQLALREPSRYPEMPHRDERNEYQREANGSCA